MELHKLIPTLGIAALFLGGLGYLIVAAFVKAARSIDDALAEIGDEFDE